MCLHKLSSISISLVPFCGQSFQKSRDVLPVRERFFEEIAKLVQPFKNRFDREFRRIHLSLQFFPFQRRRNRRPSARSRRIDGCDSLTPNVLEIIHVDVMRFPPTDDAFDRSVFGCSLNDNGRDRFGKNAYVFIPVRILQNRQMHVNAGGA